MRPSSDARESLIAVGRAYSEEQLSLIASTANNVKHYVGTIEIPGIARGTACLLEDGKVLTCLHNILDYSLLDEGRAQLIDFDKHDVSVYFVKDDHIYKHRVKSAPVNGLNKLKALGARAWCFDYALLEMETNPTHDLGGGFKLDTVDHFGSASLSDPRCTLAVSGPFLTATEEGLKIHRFTSLSENQAARGRYYHITQAGEHPTAPGFSGMGMVPIDPSYSIDTLYAIHSYRDSQGQQSGAKVSEIISSMRDKIEVADDVRLDVGLVAALKKWYEVLTKARLNPDHSVTKGSVITFAEAVEILASGGNITGDSKKEVAAVAYKAWGGSIADPAHTPLGWPHLHHPQRAVHGHALYPGSVQIAEQAARKRQAELAEERRLAQIAATAAQKPSSSAAGSTAESLAGGRGGTGRLI